MSSRGFRSRFRDIFRPKPLLEKCKEIEKQTIPEINRLLGLNYTGLVDFKIEDGMKFPAATSGNTVSVNPNWFREHPADDGAIVHELVHVVMKCPRMDESNSWMIEGIADYVRDKLGHITSWSTPTRGDPKGGYQTTAHFLLFVENKFGQDYLKRLAVTLSSRGELPDDIDDKISLYMTG